MLVNYTWDVIGELVIPKQQRDETRSRTRQESWLSSLDMLRHVHSPFIQEPLNGFHLSESL